MPELPEVETVRLGLAAAMCGCVIEQVITRRRRLRLPLPSDFSARLRGKKVTAVERRAKYLLLRAPPETCIMHLGMSGSFSVSPLPPAQKHEHIAFLLDSGQYIIYHDPRRFGLMTLTAQPPQTHALLAGLGVEPLARAFNSRVLAKLLGGKKTPIKTALMDARLIAGLGNIYAAEALFYAGIHPQKPAGKLTADDCRRAVSAIKKVLRCALRAGGSSMRDFSAADGRPGYFQTQWAVYGRGGKPCINRCGGEVRQMRQGGRSTFYCPNCQPHVD